MPLPVWRRTTSGYRGVGPMETAAVANHVEARRELAEMLVPSAAVASRTMDEDDRVPASILGDLG